jgi:hypothetical protein
MEMRGLGYFWFGIENQKRVLGGLRSPQSMQNYLPEQLFSLSRSFQPQGVIYPADQLIGYCLFILKVE